MPPLPPTATATVHDDGTATLDLTGPATTAPLALSAPANDRRDGWRWSREQLETNLAHTDPTTRDHLIWAASWSLDPAHPVPFAQFAQEIGYSDNTLGKILNARYTDPKAPTQLLPIPEKLTKALAAWRRTQIARHRLTRPAIIKTPTLLRIWQACDLARESQTTVFVTGSSQIGKTTAYDLYREENNHGRTLHISLEPQETATHLLRRLNGILGKPTHCHRAILLDQIVRSLHRDQLIIWDEFHQPLFTLRDQAFFTLVETIRAIWDRTHCGMIFSLTTLGRAKLEKERAAHLEQVFRRGVHRYDLGERPTRADIAAILKPYALTLPGKKETITLAPGTPHARTLSPYEEIAHLAQHAGLTAITERLRYATALAARQEAPAVTWDHYLTAHLMIATNNQPPATDW